MRAVRAALAARLAVVPRLVGLRLLPAGFFLVVFAPLDLGLRADRCPECLTESSADCPGNGDTTIRTESAAATQRAAMLEIGTGEESVLISSLYSAYGLPRRSGTTGVTAGCAYCGMRRLTRPTIGNPGFGSLACGPLHSSFDGVIEQVPSNPKLFATISARFPHPGPMTTIQSVAGQDEQHPDVALVERVRAGDVSAYDTLVRKYERQIFRIAQHITQNREDAEDVMQDAFLKAYQKLDQFQGNSKFYTWLVRIAVNESLMRLRKRRTGKMVSIDEDLETAEGTVPRDLADWAPDPEQNYTQSELGQILEKTIKGLPPGFKVVFELRDVQGLSTEDTAEALGLSIPAVKSRLLRARLQLRERLSRYFKQKKGSRAAGPRVVRAES